MTFGPITLGTTIEARKLAEQTEGKKRANVFTNFVLSSMFIKPQKTPGDVDNLPAETLITVVDSAVDILQIRKHFNETSLSLPVRERFFEAYFRHQQAILKESGVAVMPNLEMFTKEFPISFSNIFLEISKKALISQQIAQQLSRLTISVPTVDLKLPDIDTSSLTRALDISGSIIELVQPVSEMQEALAKQVKDITYGLDNITRRMAAHMAAVGLAVQKISSLGIFYNLIQLVQAPKDAAEAFKAADWTIAPSMPFELREHVVDMHKQGKTQYISRIIMGYYQRNNHQHLIETVESWESNSSFAPRMHILKDALQAHCQGLYTLSVPAITPQVEGVLIDYVLDNKQVVNLRKIKEVYEAAIGNADDYEFSKWVIATTLLYQLQTNTYVFTEFKDEIKKSVNTRQVTRHTVLHGVALKYDRPIDSLKAFLLLDAISVLKKL